MEWLNDDIDSGLSGWEEFFVKRGANANAEVEWSRKRALVLMVLDKLAPYLVDMGLEVCETSILNYNKKLPGGVWELDLMYLVDKAEGSGRLWVDVLDEQFQYLMHEDSD